MIIKITIVLFLLFLILLILYFFKIIYNKERYKTHRGSIMGKLKLISILNENELDFYIQLRNYLEGGDFFIFTKVRLADFLKIPNDISFSDRTIIFNKIRSKHIDFIITDKLGNILKLIELDGYSHNYKSTRISDEFKNNLFSLLGIELIRYKNSKTYNFDILESVKIANLRDNQKK